MLFRSVLAMYINAELGVETAAEALQGAKDIIAEMISETAEVRQEVREFMHDDATIVSSKNENKKEDPNLKKKDVYDVYHTFSAPLNKIKQYQILAINRGEADGYLKVILSFDKPGVLNRIYDKYFEYDESFLLDILEEVVDDSFMRLIFPSIEREVRNLLTAEADLHAIEILRQTYASFYFSRR